MIRHVAAFMPVAFCLVVAGTIGAGGAEDYSVGPVPDALRRELGLGDFYQQHVSAGGFPVLASAKASPFALREAAFLIDRMLDNRKDVREAMVRNKVRFTVMAVGELTTDVPEHSDLEPKEFWDARARGLGPTPQRPCVSCGEENLLCLPGDPYSTENILIHEFAHAIHEMGLSVVDRTFDERLRAAFANAKQKDLWKGTYAASDRKRSEERRVGKECSCRGAPN